MLWNFLSAEVRSQPKRPGFRAQGLEGSGVQGLESRVSDFRCLWGCVCNGQATVTLTSIPAGIPPTSNAEVKAGNVFQGFPV